MVKIPRPPLDPQLAKAVDRFWRSAGGQAVLRFRELVEKLPQPSDAWKAAIEAWRKRGPRFAEDEAPAPEQPVQPVALEEEGEAISDVFTVKQIDAVIARLLGKQGSYLNQT